MTIGSKSTLDYARTTSNTNLRVNLTEQKVKNESGRKKIKVAKIKNGVLTLKPGKIKFAPLRSTNQSPNKYHMELKNEIFI